jgi:mannosyltransferase
MQQHTRTAGRVALLLLMLAAFALRLYRLEAQSLWYDEGVTAEISRRGLAELTRWTAGDIQPPLYYYVVALWGRLAGWSEWSLRFPSAFFGTLTVPLLAAVTIALTRRRVAGLLAASLAASHPLLLYYSQEARMYAMLTALGVLLAYLVIQSESAARSRWRHWTAYVLVATAAAYTHYFAFFLLIALATATILDQLFVLPNLRATPAPPHDDADADLPSTHTRRPLWGFLLANLAVLLLYAPWITALLTRLAVDSSYWDGAFKLAEALRHVAISFTSGETVLEAEATRLLLPYGILTLICAVALLARRAVQPRTILYALLWLALPLTAVMLLASATPKFNPRYVMIALPGLLLLWSAGLTALIRLRGWHWAGVLRTPFVRLPSLLALITVGLLHAGFFYADRNWFMDPAFTKAEWRNVAAFVRERIRTGDTPAEDELIILVSGHAWPVWNYYAPDLPPLRLPDLQILDVNAVLDYGDTAAPLAAALAAPPHHRPKNVWLVQWQSDIIDPMEIVPLQLELAGDEARLRAKFWQVRLRRFTDVQADRLLTRQVGPTDRTINFGNLVNLLDAEIAANGDLLLYWQAHPDRSDPIPDLQIVGETFTRDGLPFARISDRRPVGYAYPPARWQPGEVNLGRIPAAEWAGPGALAGNYRVRLTVYDPNGDLTGVDMIGDQGQPVGRQAMLNLDLPVAAKGPDVMDPNTFAQVLPDLFMQVTPLDTTAEPGQAFGLEVQWYAEERPTQDVNLRLRWRQRSTGDLMGEQTLRISPGLPTSHWPDDELLRALLQARPPLNLAPDIYWLEIGVTAPESLAIRLPFAITGSSRLFTPPFYNTPVGITFGDVLHLLGIIEPLAVNPRAGEQVAVTLVWQAASRMPTDYSTSLQWLTPDGRLVAQADLSLPGGSSNWLPQQIELQSIFLAAPTTPGDYRLAAAVYNAGDLNFPRLPTADGRDLIDLGLVTVQP